MSIYDIPLTALTGESLDQSALRGKATLIVNVASRCGLTPQYEALQRLHDRYRDRGFTVLGVPCNQFGNQEPDTAEAIAAFCTSTYHVTFPLTGKCDVNGRQRHPLYARLTSLPDASGLAGDVTWNFEKFLVSTRGDTVARFRPRVEPEAPEIVAAIEAALPAGGPPSWQPRAAGEVRPGDRVRFTSGMELTVSRIEESFFGARNVVCLIEDTETRWFAQSTQVDSEVHVLT